MAVPVKKMSRTQRNLRRSGQKKKTYRTSTCSQCNQFKLSHSVCRHCGYYKGQKIIAVS